MGFQEILQTKNYINGQWLDADQHLDVFQKYTGKLIARIPIADESQVEEAIQSSYDSFSIFKNYSAEKLCL